jgi:hypothetical protein
MPLVETEAIAEPIGQRGYGRAIAIVAAHGGAGATQAAAALVRELAGPLCVIDADLAGGDLGARIGIPERASDAGLAAHGGGESFAAIGRRAPFGWFAAICPRPELAWLVRDGVIRDAVREAQRHAPLVIADLGRAAGPAHEILVIADLVIVVADEERDAARDGCRRRLTRLGVDVDRVVDHAWRPGPLRRLVRLRPFTDEHADGELALLVEGRLAVLPGGGRR